MGRRKEKRGGVDGKNQPGKSGGEERVLIQFQEKKGEDKGKEEMGWGECKRIVRSGHGED